MRKNRVVHRIWLLVFIVILSSFLANCSRTNLFSNLLPKNVTLLVQDYWWAGEDGEHRIKNKLPAVINSTKFRYHYIVIDEGMDALKKAEAQIKRKRNAVVVFDPVLTLKIGDKILKSTKETPFLVFLDGFTHYLSDTYYNSNFISVAFNTEDTYRKAGKICAELIKNNGKVSEGSVPGSFQGNLSGIINGETKIGILYYSFDRIIKKKLDRFKEGFLNYGYDSQLIDAKINSLSNKQAVQHSLRNLKEKGAGMFLLLTLNLTPYCLDILEKTGGIAVVEGSNYTDLYRDVILFSINSEPEEGIKEALQAFLNSNRKSAGIEVKASIKWGNLQKGDRSVH